MYIVGVDGGQSSTLALVANSKGKIIGSVTAGPANHIHEPGGPERCRRALTDAIGGAFRRPRALLRPRRGSRHGYDRRPPADAGHSPRGAQNPRMRRAPQLRSRRREHARRRLGRRAGLHCHQRHGFRRFRLETLPNREKQTGGWGYLFGTKGGWWIGVELLRAASRQADGRDPRRAPS